MKDSSRFVIPLFVLFSLLLGVLPMYAHRPGPNYIYECTRCYKLIQNKSNASGNTIGAKIYSDRKVMARMLPSYPVITKCTSCNTYLCLSDMTPIGNCYIGDDDCKASWANAPYAEFLSQVDLKKALESKIARTKSNELRLRMELWWSYNDGIRDNQNKALDGKDVVEWEKNCRALLNLVDSDSTFIQQRELLQAELYRNLSDFKKAITIIDKKNTINDEATYFQAIKKECLKKNRWVVRIL